MNARQFFAELKRRNVYKVAVAYAVVAWLLMQIASQIFPFFEIPNWAVRLVVLLLVIGFPVAMILAWAFELTPEGIKRAEDVDLSKSVRRKTGRKLDFFIIAVLLLVIGILVFQRLHPNISPAVSSSLEKSIAVLPFENLSEEKGNAYFAEGIKDEILTKLATVRDLKVISRTSTAKYQSKPDNLKIVAQELGISTVLEGAVQKAGDKVRVNVQLIDARADTHLWAKSYDRDLKEEVKSLIDRALALAPNSPEAHLALGLLSYSGHRQYKMALTEFNRALELQPNNAFARRLCAPVYRRRGEWERSLADFQRAEELDPRDARIPDAVGSTYLALRLWKDAERAELRALAIDPHSTLAALDLLITRLNGTGDADSARQALDGFPEGTTFIDSPVDRGDIARIIDARVYLDVIERSFTDAFQTVEKEVTHDDGLPLQQLAGRVALRVLAEQTEAAKSAGEEARPLLEARLRERPDDTSVMTGLSWVYLALGRNADALRLSRQAADTISIERDALAGPNFQNGLAQIEVRAGAPEEAIKRLRHLLSIPAGRVVSIARLKIDPVWDPIRNRPDFQQLLLGPEQVGPTK